MLEPTTLVQWIASATWMVAECFGWLPHPEPWRPIGDSDDVELLDSRGAMALDANLRDVWIDYDALGISEQTGGEWITYDYEEVTRKVSASELRYEREISLAVRLIISEVGADRLLMNRFGWHEAIGILYTVDNRLDPLVYDPQNNPLAPRFPGCGTRGDFYSCANAQQYLGMSTWRALDPGRSYDPEVLAAATDQAVAAWWLQEHRWVPDITDGATNYVHRCGDAAYGLTTPHCDAHMGRPADDIRGGNPFTGPIVFKAPEVFRYRSGVYALYESRRIEFDPWFDVEGWSGDALADAGDSDDIEFATDGPAFLPNGRFPAPDPVAANPIMRGWVDEIGPPLQPQVVTELLAAYD